MNDGRKKEWDSIPDPTSDLKRPLNHWFPEDRSFMEQYEILWVSI